MTDQADDAEVVFSAEGLSFREWRADDVQVMVSLFDTEQMNRWTPLASPFSTEVARNYIERARQARDTGTLHFAITAAPRTSPIGEILIFPATRPGEVELAYAVGAGHQGQGVATRAVLAAVDFVRSRGARRVVLSIAEDNDASAGVARAAGFALTDAPLRERRRKGFVLQLQTWARELPAA